MAAGKVTMVYTAEDAQLMRKQENLNQQITKQEKKLKRLTEASKKGNKSAVSGAADWAKGLVGVATVVGSVTKVYADLRAEIERTGKVGLETTQKLMGSLAGAGDTAHTREIRQGLRSMKGAGHLNMGQRVGVYDSVRGSLPTASRKKVMGLTQVAAMSSRISGQGEDGGKSFGLALGEVSKLGYSNNDAADVALSLSQTAGRHGKKLGRSGFAYIQQLMATGMGKDEAVSYAMAAYDSGQGSSALSALASWHESGKKSRLAPAGKALLGAYAKKDYLGQVRSAASGDYFQQQLSASRGDKDQRMLVATQEAQAASSIADFDNRQQGMKAIAGRSFFDAELKKRQHNPTMRWIGMTMYDTMTTLGADPEEAIKYAYDGFNGAGQDMSTKFRQSLSGGGNTQDLTAAIKEMSATSKQQKHTERTAGR